MEFTKIKVISRSTDFYRMTQGLLRSTVNGQRSTDNGQRSHPDGSLLSIVYSLLTLFINVITGNIQKYPCDTRDTWRPVNAPQGNLLNLFNQLIIITLRVTYLRVFLSTDYRDYTDF